jgi:nicotinamide phosphoribosyltransferase
VELLWVVFGGTITDKGYKILDSHIGAIYGDSINLQRAEAICEGLKCKGFASQVVFGIGSYTYQYNTRDTFGLAMKATYVEVNGEGREIFKNPVTDDGTKKSATGLLQVKEESGSYILHDKVSWDEEKNSELKTVFKDGKLVKEYSLREIRKIIHENRKIHRAEEKVA